MDTCTTPQQCSPGYFDEYKNVPVQLAANLSLPYPMVERMISERLRNLETTQKNNHIAALSMLKSAVVSFLQFERCFKSMLSKGDCAAQIKTLESALTDIRAASQPYDALLDKLDPLRVFIVEPQHIVDVRELYAYCANVLVHMLKLLGADDLRAIGSSVSHTGSSMTWVSWQQIAQCIVLYNNALHDLLDKQEALKDIDRHYAAVNKEVRLFSLCVSHVTDSIFVSKYPTKAQIIKIYEEARIDIQRYIKLDTALSSSEPINGKEMKSSSTLVAKNEASAWF